MRAWPLCGGGCGGPAAPDGESHFRVRFVVETRSEANLRDRWAKVKRTQKARDATIEAFALALGSGQVLPEIGPWYVRITRISRGKLDDDNKARALKAIQDSIAAMLKVDDGSPTVVWRREQRSEGGFLGVEIEIWSLG